MSMVIEPAQLEDAAEILVLQKLAYRDEAALYDDYTIPPLSQTLQETERDFKNQLVLKATIDGQIIGSVRAYLKVGVQIWPDTRFERYWT